MNKTLYLGSIWNPKKKRNSPVSERHALEELVQGCLDA